jgi:hypothetical protein
VTLLKLAGTAYYSLPFSRRGDSALFSVNVEQVTAGATLDVDVEHKNVEDTTCGPRRNGVRPGVGNPC